MTPNHFPEPPEPARAGEVRGLPTGPLPASFPASGPPAAADGAAVRRGQLCCRMCMQPLKVGRWDVGVMRSPTYPHLCVRCGGKERIAEWREDHPKGSLAYDKQQPTPEEKEHAERKDND